MTSSSTRASVSFNVSTTSKSNILLKSEHHTELDSHADTCVVGRNALIIQDFNRTASMTGYDPSLGVMNDKHIVSTAIAYDCFETGGIYILIVHQAIHIDTMDNDLLCPMQLRISGI